MSVFCLQPASQASRRPARDNLSPELLTPTQVRAQETGQLKGEANANARRLCMTNQMMQNSAQLKQLQTMSQLMKSMPEPTKREAAKPAVSKSDNGNVVQRYTTSVNGAYNVSTNQEFAVPTAAYPNVILTQHRPPMNLAGGLVWEQNGVIPIDGVNYTQYMANIDAYEHGEAGNIVGSSQFCGEFARGITGGPAPTEEASQAEEGGILYDNNTTPDREDGWVNHYAAVVMVDAGDHATFETAVGINHVWAGIYGTARGQTFKYRTQLANIERLIAMEDIVFPAQYRTERSFWDYLFCRRGKRVQTMEETRVARGVTEGEGHEWMRQMNAWRDNNIEPTDPYVIRIVEKLEAEEQALQQN